VRSEQSIKIEDMNQQKKEDSIIEKDIDSPKSDVLKSNTNGTPSTSNKVTGKSVRINIEKLDKVINLVGELVINRSRLIQISREHGLDDLSNTISIVEKTISDLQYEITQMRMLPVEHIFNRFPKLVRDLYRTQGKEIELKIYGKEIELDRIVLEEIVDPLVHLIRNSVDHGIEMPDEREKIGKNRKGTIILSATRETGFVVISIEDDGKGINPIDIKNSAIEKAKISKENASKLSENQILQLIFLPGFSTKQVATKISGRGVGMDVVKTKIEGMGGQVSIDSTIGKGSKMHLKIPLTTAIIQALLVKVGDKIYAIPLSQVLEIISISKNDIKTIQTKNVITLRDSIIPIIMLRNLFNQNSPTLKNDNESQVVIIIGRSDGQIGLVVDEAMEQQEIVVKPPDELLCNTKALSGFTILGNGKVVSILDVSSI
ncbi:MAG: chemotaxis protein CheA, partial [Methanosarcinaceae archaeon]|nr:chemotaxis protein CheA [Methanosarcinaceae archaeon]